MKEIKCDFFSVNRKLSIFKIKSALEARYPDMWRNYVKGMFDIDFFYATRNTLRQKRKLRRLVDERDEIRRDLT